tara:strand:+ start:6978 stop:7430 length:453 start_codon:yes stop_codon:yes gene_type:complete
MLCGSCGSEYSGNPKFCGKCGVAISQKKRITEDLINKDSFASKVSNQYPKRNIDPNRKKTQPFSGPIRINGFFYTLIIGFSFPIGSATISRPIYYIFSSLFGDSDVVMRQLIFMFSQMISGIIISIPLLIIIISVCEFINWIINSFQEEK